MENLNKENLFNELYEKYPKGMQIFCDWIDKYKKENNWNKLFNSDSEYQNSDGKNAPAPKYHELPIAMQIGIWIEFVTDMGGCQWEVENLMDYDWREDIKQIIKNINE